MCRMVFVFIIEMKIKKGVFLKVGGYLFIYLFSQYVKA